MERKSPGTRLSSHELKILHKPVGDSMCFSFNLALTLRVDNSAFSLEMLGLAWLGFLYWESSPGPYLRWISIIPIKLYLHCSPVLLVRPLWNFSLSVHHWT